MKYLIKDSKGNIITSLTAILIIATIISSIILISTIVYINNENSASIANDNFKYQIDDYENNVDDLLRESTKELSEKVIKSKTPSKDAGEDIKKILNNKLKKFSPNINSEVLVVENTSDPSFIQTKIKVTSNNKFNKIITTKASIEGLHDPLPVLKCGYHKSFTYNDTTISYHDSLSDYLEKNNLKNPEGYINATSPFIIKKCPYDPYIHHGDNLTLKNCLDNGYYHESADGSCYLCRLEGKGKCPHYGFEVFIKASENSVTESISASDHVIFNDQYPGERYYYDIDHSIFLDSSHRKKYGLI